MNIMNMLDKYAVPMREGLKTIEELKDYIEVLEEIIKVRDYEIKELRINKDE